MPDATLNRRVLLATAGAAGLGAIIPGEVSAQVVAQPGTLPFPSQAAGILHGLNVQASLDTLREIAGARSAVETITGKIKAVTDSMAEANSEFFTKDDAKHIDKIVTTLEQSVERGLKFAENELTKLSRALRDDRRSPHVVIAVFSIVMDSLKRTQDLIRQNEPAIKHVILIVLCDMLGALRGVDKAIKVSEKDLGFLGQWKWAVVLVGAVAGGASASAFSAYEPGK